MWDREFSKKKEGWALARNQERESNGKKKEEGILFRPKEKKKAAPPDPAKEKGRSKETVHP